MGKNLQKLFSFRTENELILKLNIIADYNSRTRNKEIEFVLKEHVRNFEKEHGIIDISNIDMPDTEQESSTTQINNINAIAVQQKNIIKK